MAKRTRKAPRKFVVGIVLYPDFDLLDVAGPYDVFTFLDGGVINRTIEVVTVAEHRRSLTASGGLTVTPAHDFESCPRIDLLFVPGAGSGIADTIANDRFLELLRRAARGSRYVTAVCTGGIMLAAAGLLDGYQATTHWSCIDCLKLFPKVTVVNGCPRYVHDRNRITGGGISSSIDEALFMVETVVADLTGRADKGAEAAQHMQLSIQYNPQPPFSAGDPCTADYAIYAPVAAGMKSFHDSVYQAVEKHLQTGAAQGAPRRKGSAR